MGLKERLLAVKTRNKADKQTIEDAIAFVIAVTNYAKHQQKVFKSLGYVPVEGDQNNDKN